MSDAFCVIGNVGGEAERCCHEVRFETRRCVKMRLWLGTHWGSLQRPQTLLAGFGEVNGEE